MDTTQITIPISDRTAYLSRVHVGITIPVLALTLVPFFARLYIRIRPTWRIGWDDAFVIVGFVSIPSTWALFGMLIAGMTQMLAISDWALLQFEVFMQPTLLSFPAAIKAMKLAYIAIPVWGCAMTCIKISAALTLLRIPLSAWWRAFLYVVTGLQVAYFVGNTVFIFVACIPLRGIWDIRVAGTARCLGPESSRIASNVGSGINISTDILLSLAPMFILWNMRRPLRERVLVCTLTGIGLLASVSSLVKAIMVRKWGEPGIDTWAVAISIATWTILEQFLAVMATCSPALKGPLQRALKSVGVFITSYNSHVSFVEVRRSRIVRALTEDGDNSKEPRAPSPAHFRSEEAIKTHFTLSTSRSQLDLETGSSRGSQRANELDTISSHDGEKHECDNQQTVASAAKGS